MNNLIWHRPKVFYGWCIVAASVLISTYALGVIASSFTAFIGPLAGEFGWSHAEISIGASLRGLEGGFFAPLVGFFIDRWDARKMMLTGVATVGLGFFLLSQVNSLWTFYAIFIIIGAGMSTIYPVLPMTVVARWFKSNAAIATGIITSGTALAGLMIPLVTRVIDSFGWRMALVIFSIGVWCILLPLALLVRSSPEKYGYYPDGFVGNKQDATKKMPKPQPVESSINIAHVLKSEAFWHVSIAVMLLWLVISAVTVHVMPYLSSIGIERSVSSMAASAIPLVSILGRLSTGWFGNRIDKRKVAAVCSFLVGISMFTAGFFYTVASWQLFMLVVLCGVGWGGMVPMQPSLLGKYFGGSKMGTVLGISISLSAIGMAVGAPVAGWVYDQFESYRYCWLALSAVAIASGVCVLTGPSIKEGID